MFLFYWVLVQILLSHAYMISIISESVTFPFTVKPVYSSHLWTMKKWPSQGGGLFMVVKTNGQSTIGAHKGGLYREVALL